VDGRERQACFGRALPLSSAASGVAARGESAPVSAKGNFPEGGGPAGGASGKRGDVESRAAATALPALLFNIISVGGFPERLSSLASHESKVAFDPVLSIVVPR